ncbi:MAG: DNA repair protein RecN [Akkermansiaceae bacterium]|nr:DNA repair protein RecN [Akkermansiaceae bacterium]
MLSLLKIANLALVEKLEWELGGGLVGVTGETGAGKSVIVGALKLVLGERAAKGLIRTGESGCQVEAIFDLPDPEGANRVLEEAGLEPCDDGQLIIKRVVGASSNRQFVNNSPATLGVLKALAGHLVDLHGPHEHQSLLAVERQLVMLDAYAGARREMEAYAAAWRGWREKKSAWDELRHAEDASEQELELLRHQVEEIESAEIDPAEESDLQDRYQRSANSARLVELAAQAQGLLEEEEAGVMSRLAELQRVAREIERHDGTAAEWTGGLESALVELEDLGRQLEHYLGEIALDPQQAAALEARVDLLEGLKRKYGPTLEDVVERGRTAAERLGSVENRGELLERLEGEVAAAREELGKAGEALGAKRRKAAPRLAKEIRKHLAELGFKQAAFEVNLGRLEEPAATGMEAVEFGFGPNPGEPLKPLRQIASSGEISRVMLSVKSALAKQDRTPLMVFDEIDANVGGEIARAVGEKMAALGEEHQVVAITHFPQVAASAGQHFLVEKRVEKGRTLSGLREVRGEERLDELVRMLGGGGDEAREMARSLVG